MIKKITVEKIGVIVGGLFAAVSIQNIAVLIGQIWVVNTRKRIIDSYNTWAFRQYLLTMMLLAMMLLILFISQFKFITLPPYFSCNLKHRHHRGSDLVSHNLEIGSYSICVGCSGTIIGLLVAIIGSMSYMIFPTYFIELVKVNEECYYLVGFMLVLLCYSRYFFQLSAWIRLLQHIFLPLGSFHLLIIADIIFKNPIVLLGYFFSITVLFMVRNGLSTLYHRDTP